MRAGPFGEAQLRLAGGGVEFSSCNFAEKIANTQGDESRGDRIVADVLAQLLSCVSGLIDTPLHCLAGAGDSAFRFLGHALIPSGATGVIHPDPNGAGGNWFKVFEVGENVAALFISVVSHRGVERPAGRWIMSAWEPILRERVSDRSRVDRLNGR